MQVTAGKASDVMRLGGRFNFGMPRMEFDGPGTMMFGPDMGMMRERMPMIRKQLEPLEEPFIFDEMFDLDEPFLLDFDEPFEFENEIEPVSPEVIRELAATAILDARVALKHLAADGIA